MPYWYWDKKDIECNTPSIQDGLDYATENKYRKEGSRLIIDIGTVMDLGCNTLATGVVFFHRFYMFHSFKTFPHNVTACCCLFLAGKVEETPKKCKDIIKVAKTLMSEDNFAIFGSDPKEEVMILEKILLQTIKFDLKVQHPYNYLTKYAKSLKGNKIKLQKMVQMAWTFINDSLCTTLSIEWEPEIIAIAVMYLAGKLCKFKVNDWSYRRPEHLHWWDVFIQDLDVKILEDICHQILNLYSPPHDEKTNDSPIITQPTKLINNNHILQSTVTTNTNTTINPLLLAEMESTSPSKRINDNTSSVSIKNETTSPFNYMQKNNTPFTTTSEASQVTVPWMSESSVPSSSLGNVAYSPSGPIKKLILPPLSSQFSNSHDELMNNVNSADDALIMSSKSFQFYDYKPTIDDTCYSTHRNNDLIPLDSSDLFRSRNGYNIPYEYVGNHYNTNELIDYTYHFDNFQQNRPLDPLKNPQRFYHSFNTR